MWKFLYHLLGKLNGLYRDECKNSDPLQLLFILYINAATWWYITGTPCVCSNTTLKICRGIIQRSDPGFNDIIITWNISILNWSVDQLRKDKKGHSNKDHGGIKHIHTQTYAPFTFARTSIKMAALGGGVNGIICHATQGREHACPLDVMSLLAEMTAANSPVSLHMEPCQPVKPSGLFNQHGDNPNSHWDNALKMGKSSLMHPNFHIQKSKSLSFVTVKDNWSFLCCLSTHNNTLILCKLVCIWQ